LTKRLLLLLLLLLLRRTKPDHNGGLLAESAHRGGLPKANLRLLDERGRCAPSGSWKPLNIEE
jgi:hypothetical protein